MSIEDIIKTIETGMKCGEKDCCFDCENCDLDMPDGEFGQALRTAIALLRTHLDAQRNEPLTEAEVEEYKGKPLWFERPSLNHCSGGKWEIVDGVNTYDHVIILRGGKIVRGYGLDAVAYLRPPKEDAK